MSLEIVLLISCCIITAFLIIFRKTSFVKKYWRYSLILIPGIVLLILKIAIVIRQKNTTVPQDSPSTPTIKDNINEIKDKLEEVDMVVKIESTVAKTKNDQLMNELKEAQQIKDQREKLKKLASMINR